MHRSDSGKWVEEPHGVEPACCEGSRPVAEPVCATLDARDLPTCTQIGGNHYIGYTIQPAEFMNANRVPYLEGEAIYKILRHRDKNGREDIEKAIHTLELLLQLEYPDAKPIKHQRESDR
jgi:hypothetical protein